MRIENFTHIAELINLVHFIIRVLSRFLLILNVLCCLLSIHNVHVDQHIIYLLQNTCNN